MNEWMNEWMNEFIYLFIYLCIYLFIYLFHSFIYLFTYSNGLKRDETDFQLCCGMEVMYFQIVWLIKGIFISKECRRY